MRKILFVVNGPLGKNILATHVAKSLSLECDRLHVQASHPDVFLNLDFVDKVFPLEPIPYFYDEHFDFEIIRNEPFENINYRLGQLHILKTWDKISGVKEREPKCEIKLDQTEIMTGKYIVEKISNKHKIIAFQPIGGNYSNTRINTTKQPRDIPIPIAQEIVNKLVGNGYLVLHVGFPNEMVIKNVIPLNKLFKEENISERMLFSVVNACHYCIGIDSMLNHLWNALGKDNAVMLWGNTNPDTLGYMNNKNLRNADCCKNIHCNRPSIIGDFIGNRKLWKCRFETACMNFKSDDVVKTFLDLINKQ